MTEIEVVAHKDVYEALAAAYHDCGYVQKKHAQGLGYKFAGEQAMIEEIRPALVKHGLFAYVSEMGDLQQEAFTTSRGSSMNRVILRARVTFAHGASGTSVTATAYGEGMDSGDKATNKAMTGALKYALRQTLLIETGDDPDETPSREQERRPAAARAQEHPEAASSANGERPRNGMAGDWAALQEWMKEHRIGSAAVKEHLPGGFSASSLAGYIDSGHTLDELFAAVKGGS